MARRSGRARQSLSASRSQEEAPARELMTARLCGGIVLISFTLSHISSKNLKAIKAYGARTLYGDMRTRNGARDSADVSSLDGPGQINILDLTLTVSCLAFYT